MIAYGHLRLKDYLLKHNNILPNDYLKMVAKCPRCKETVIRESKNGTNVCSNCQDSAWAEKAKHIDDEIAKKSLYGYCRNPDCKTISGHSLHKFLKADGYSSVYCCLECKQNHSKILRASQTKTIIENPILTKKEKENQKFYRDLKKSTLACEIAQRKVYGQGGTEWLSTSRLSSENKKLSKEIKQMISKRYQESSEKDFLERKD